MSDVISTKPVNPKDPWDVIIIGSGPAALTSAIYTTRGAASTLILGGVIWGGQLMQTTIVDNFPGFPDGVQGSDLMEKMKAQAIRFGAEFVAENVTAVDFTNNPLKVTAGEKIYTAKSVIIATGAQTLWLEASGIKELIGRGISSCAPCDAPFFKNKKVAVVGGGDSAMEEAYVLTKYATEVTIIHRRDSFKATPAMQEKVKENSKIKIMWNTEVVKANGSVKLESLELKNVLDNTISTIPFDGLFIAIGHKPTSDVFKGIVNMDDKGYLLNSEWHCGTNIKGVFVAGDVVDKDFKQAIVASGMGCIAAMEAIKYLESV